jgi:hypothetical protein
VRLSESKGSVILGWGGLKERQISALWASPSEHDVLRTEQLRTPVPSHAQTFIMCFLPTFPPFSTWWQQKLSSQQYAYDYD